MSEEWRHITPNATEEILCDGQHKISYAQSGPSGNFSVRSSSMGSMKPGLILIGKRTLPFGGSVAGAAFMTSVKIVRWIPHK
jgi:hypothetical protein